MAQPYLDTILALPPMALALALAALLLWGQLLLWWWASARGRRQAELRRRLRMRLAEAGDGSPALLRDVAYAGNPTFDRMLRALPGTAWLHDLLDRADSEMDVARLLRRMMVFAAVAGLAVNTVLPLALPTMAAAFASASLPVLALLRESPRRARLLWRQLPDALDLMTRSLRAGHGVGAALHLVATEMPMPIAMEFARAYDRHRLGEDLSQALAALATRNGACRDLRFFAIAVSLQRETGGNLVEILENLARTVRARFTLHAKVDALTAEARLSSRVVGAMPVVTFLALMVLRKEYLQVALADPIGRGMIIAGFAWFAVGVGVMRRVLQVEV